MKLTLQYKPNIWFTSDFHLSHSNVIKHDNRPFENVYYMHEHIIRKWNEKVFANDIVFYLGDLTLGDWRKAKQIVDRLKGKIYFILGNHDKASKIERINRFELVEDYIELNIDDKGKKYQLILCHYPLLTWNKKHFGTIHLHGHSHGNLMKEFPEYYNGNVIDISCNLWNYEPIEFKEILKLIEEKKEDGNGI